MNRGMPTENAAVHTRPSWIVRMRGKKIACTTYAVFAGQDGQNRAHSPAPAKSAVHSFGTNSV